MERVGTQYYYVYSKIITDIYTGKYIKGDILPTLSEFCSIYDVGRNTVRTAMQLLESEGYIVTAPRKQPVVCFDFDNLEYRAKYVKQLASRKKAIGEAYEALAILMPDIVCCILRSVSEDTRREIGELVSQCATNIPANTEQELSRRLMGVYQKAIKLGENSLLEQMFLDIYEFALVPLTDTERNGVIFRTMIPLIQWVLRRFQKQVLTEDYEGLKHQIAFFCQTAQGKTEGHLKRICKGVDYETESEFFWVPRGRYVMNYMLLASDIICKIRSGHYQEGTLIPSYAQLAELSQLSEQTSRRAVAILSRLRVVERINGVGTRVLPLTKRSAELFFEDRELQNTLQAFLDTLDIMRMTCRPFAEKAIQRIDERDIRKARRQMQEQPKQVASDLLDIIYMTKEFPVVTHIYQQWKKILAWGYLMEGIWNDITENGESQMLELIDLMEKKDGRRFTDLLCECLESVLYKLKKIIEEKQNSRSEN